jgi:hypothetical protein
VTSSHPSSPPSTLNTTLNATSCARTAGSLPRPAASANGAIISIDADTINSMTSRLPATSGAAG